MKALAMAGDLTMYGVRDNILLVRTVDGKIEKVRVDLTRSDFMESPYYNLKQGDVIYVSANKTKEKTSRLDPNMPIYISVASIVVTILALVFKNNFNIMSASSQDNQYTNEEVKINEIIKPYLLKWPWFIICAVLAVIVAFFYIEICNTCLSNSVYSFN